ncbi:MAG TPA: NUDIX hydrolase, partial [Verrucomicrobiae bacterium]|nr:NUDIX hydrolase [Verrucomicrobiae bacterium]
EACARRELQEETGLRGGELTSLGFIYSTPGFCDEKIHLFLATGLTEGESEPEEYEEIEAVRLPLQEAVEAAVSGGICDGKSVVALLRAAQRLR